VALHQLGIGFSSSPKQLLHFFALPIVIIAPVGIYPLQRVVDAAQKELRCFPALGRRRAAAEIGGAGMGEERVRFLEKSKAQWKGKAQALEAENAHLKAKAQEEAWPQEASIRLKKTAESPHRILWFFGISPSAHL